MPAVAKKMVKSVTSKLKDVAKKPKKQSLKKIQKTAEIKAAKKLAKLKSAKAVSETLNRAPLVKKQKSKHQFDPTRLNRGVMLVKNIPKGFFEEQLKKYFSQYGRVTRLRVARSEETGGSKGFAYVEFKYPEVAKVACEAMNGYLMFRQRLKTVYIPPDQQDHDYFKQPVRIVNGKDGKRKLITPKKIRAQEAVQNYNKPVTPEAHANRVQRSEYKLKLMQKKLAKAGINIDLSGQLFSTDAADSASAKPTKETKETKNAKNKKEKSTKKPKKVEAVEEPKVVKTKKEKLIKVSKKEVEAEAPKPVQKKIAKVELVQKKKAKVEAAIPSKVKMIASKPVAVKTKTKIEPEMKIIKAKKEKQIKKSKQEPIVESPKITKTKKEKLTKKAKKEAPVEVQKIVKIKKDKLNTKSKKVKRSDS